MLVLTWRIYISQEEKQNLYCIYAWLCSIKKKDTLYSIPNMHAKTSKKTKVYRIQIIQDHHPYNLIWQLNGRSKIAHQICRDKEYLSIMWSEDSAYLSQSPFISEACKPCRIHQSAVKWCLLKASQRNILTLKGSPYVLQMRSVPCNLVEPWCRAR
jgi:uncharacterized protein (DUF2249 family)